jgi:hypothetical protein
MKHAIQCGFPLSFVPKKMIDFNIAKEAIILDRNNIMGVPAQ